MTRRQHTTNSLLTSFIIFSERGRCGVATVLRCLIRMKFLFLLREIACVDSTRRRSFLSHHFPYPLCNVAFPPPPSHSLPMMDDEKKENSIKILPAVRYILFFFQETCPAVVSRFIDPVDIGRLFHGSKKNAIYFPPLEVVKKRCRAPSSSFSGTFNSQRRCNQRPWRLFWKIVAGAEQRT